MRKSPLADKRWKKEQEPEIFAGWLKRKPWAKPDAERVYVIDTPPPYPSGKIHIGNAIHYSQIDMIARSWRMMGKPVWFPLGIDRNGLPIESRVEKDHGIKAHEMERGKFLEICRRKLNEYEAYIMKTFQALGISMDWDNPYRTDSPEYRKVTQATFIELWNKGLIYEAKQPNNWCPGCQTTLADAEIEYRSGKTKLNYIKFAVDGGGHISIATTRPELLGACDAVIVHPDDERFAKFVGKKVKVPLYGRKVEVFAHPEAKPDFGTGAMMLCSYGDQTDVKLFKELGLTERLIIEPDGTLNDGGGRYAGMHTKEARSRIIEDLKKEGLLEKSEEIEQQVPVCWRSKDDIEFVALPEFYLKQQEFVEEVRKIADGMQFHPLSMKQLLVDWMDRISRDWPVSRRRFYGTPIPLFKCEEHGYWAPEPGRYYESWKEELPCPKCGKKCRGDPRVLDTWMDSSISALYVAGYLHDDEFFKKAFPTFLRPQGKDIVRTWLFYSLLRSLQLTGKRPFDHAWISGHVVDKNGKKMSKSLGNILYPIPMIEKYGADALRFQGASEAKLGSDIRLSEERVNGAGKFIQKLYNIARFVGMFNSQKVNKPKIIHNTDKWIMSEANKIIEASLKGYLDMDLFIPANSVRNFTWEIFASHYIELAKARAYNNDESAVWTLNEVLKVVLKLLAPIIPFVTEHVWTRLYGGSVHEQRMPEKFNVDDPQITQRLVGFNEKVWTMKKEKGISLKDSVKMQIPAELKAYEDDLKAMHSLIVE